MQKTGAAPGAAGRHASPDGFRLDINALRALSVIAVVGFHFQIAGFAGGFVGVDVFLVITGYLMTAKVLNELKLGRFSPWTFWMMRMRRIYPALAVLTIASVIAGWFVTLPAEYTRHLLQALSALTFLSNFAFKSDSGYFAMAAQTKPLTRTPPRRRPRPIAVSAASRRPEDVPRSCGAIPTSINISNRFLRLP